MRAEYALHWSQLKYFLLYMVKWHSLRSLGRFKEGGEGCEKPHLPNPLVVGCKDIFFVYKKPIELVGKIVAKHVLPLRTKTWKKWCRFAD